MISDIDKTWTLFLDRDGVINKKKENDYVRNWDDFVFIDGSLTAISILSKVFGKIIVVTNQRGVGKGLMTEDDLNSIHIELNKEVLLNQGKIDKIYYCTDESEFSECRKPNLGMGHLALFDFPDIDFVKSVMVGDSNSDLMFGQRLGMKTVFIGDSNDKFDIDEIYTSLFEFSLQFISR